MNIRRAERGDIPAVLRLLEQVNLIHAAARPDLFNIATKYDAAELDEIFKTENTPVFVADDGAVLGYVFCIIKKTENSRLLKNAKTLYIDDLCVDESARGKGIGGRLFEYVESFGKSVGCDSITLNVWEQNTAARRFYDACGMTPQKTTMEKKI